MENVEQTIISQYSNSATIVQLIRSMNEYIDPSANIDNFYRQVWDITTAEGYGLDVWGRIVGIQRGLTVPADTPNPGMFAFTPGTYALSDTQFRTVILVKALTNITNCTAVSLNQLLSNLFAGRGRCYVRDLGNMAMVFDFEFFLQPFEYVSITQSGVVPRPAGVQSSVFQVDPANTFGFAEQLNMQPFDQGTFYVSI